MDNNKEHNKHKTGFKVPDNYFEDLNNSLYKKISISTDCNSSLFPEKTGFTTPDNYFETFKVEVHDHSKKDQKPKVIRLNTKKKLLYGLSIAASLILLITLVLPTKSNDTLNFESLNTTTFNSYIETEHETIDTYMIAEVFEDEIDDLNLISNDDVIDESLIDYLNNEDATHLIEEL